MRIRSVCSVRSALDRALDRALAPLVAAGLAALALAASGCGYSLVRHHGPLADDAPRMCLRTLDNDSMEPGLERIVSEALRREWLQRGRYRLVDDPAKADWVLSGRVLPVQVRTETLSPVVLALEHTIELAIELRIDRGRAEAGPPRELPNASLRESEIYFASPDLEVGRKNRGEALRRVSSLIASRAHAVVDRELAP